jgi:hypothetical protein
MLVWRGPAILSYCSSRGPVGFGANESTCKVIAMRHPRRVLLGRSNQLPGPRGRHTQNAGRVVRRSKPAAHFDGLRHRL